MPHCQIENNICILFQAPAQILFVQQYLPQFVEPTTKPTPTPVSPPVLESVLDVRESVHVLTVSVWRSTNQSVEMMDRHTPTRVKQIVPEWRSSVRKNVPAVNDNGKYVLYQTKKNKPEMIKSCDDLPMQTDTLPLKQYLR